MNRDFKGIWIPKQIYLNRELSWADKILLVEIDSLDNEKGCFASNAYFAEFLNVSETAISKSISKLKKHGFVYQDSFDGRKRVLKTCFKAELNKSSRQDETKVQGTLEEKFNHSNTVNKPISNSFKKKESIDSKKIKTPSKIDYSSFSDPFIETLNDFKDMRKIIKAPLTLNAEKLVLKSLEGFAPNDEAKKIKILERSIMNSWKGVFDIEERKSKFKPIKTHLAINETESIEEQYGF